VFFSGENSSFFFFFKKKSQANLVNFLGTFEKNFKIYGGSKDFLLYTLNFSQIWLSNIQPFLFWLHIVKKLKNLKVLKRVLVYAYHCGCSLSIIQ
jgi:hypothetical protein